MKSLKFHKEQQEIVGNLVVSYSFKSNNKEAREEKVTPNPPLQQVESININSLPV